jgi:hypothetical protein
LRAVAAGVLVSPAGGSMTGTTCFRRLCQEPDTSLPVINDLPNRTSPGILKNPTVIDRAWETGRSTTFKIKKSRSLPCPQGENRRARTNGFDWQRQFAMMRAW